MTRRLAMWALLLAALALAPLLFSKGFALSLLCQTGILVIFALSYNMQLGQTGLLSFGHAVYYGLGALFSIHALNLGYVPTPLVPLVDDAGPLLEGDGIPAGHRAAWYANWHLGDVVDPVCGADCGNDLSRENIMRQAASLKNYRNGIVLPGIAINTGPADFHPIKQMRLVQFDGNAWQPIGDVIESAFASRPNDN